MEASPVVPRSGLPGPASRHGGDADGGRPSFSLAAAISMMFGMCGCVSVCAVAVQACCSVADICVVGCRACIVRLWRRRAVCPVTRDQLRGGTGASRAYPSLRASSIRRTAVVRGTSRLPRRGARCAWRVAARWLRLGRSRYFPVGDSVWRLCAARRPRADPFTLLYFAFSDARPSRPPRLYLPRARTRQCLSEALVVPRLPPCDVYLNL